MDTELKINTRNRYPLAKHKQNVQILT